MFIAQEDASLTNDIMVVLGPCSYLMRASGQEGSHKYNAKFKRQLSSHQEIKEMKHQEKHGCHSLSAWHPLCLPRYPVQATAILWAIASLSAKQSQRCLPHGVLWNTEHTEWPGQGVVTSRACLCRMKKWTAEDRATSQTGLGGHLPLGVGKELQT